MTSTNPPSFDQFQLDKTLLRALNEVGYETPSPIQAEAIPPLMAGKDIIGQAQTGTGKTAAFALPLLSRLQLKQSQPQVLVLTPTRELAIQVAEAFQKYAHHMKGFHVLPIYGGQDYRGQMRGLKRGAHIVVGTPGRVMDHMRRGTLKLDQLAALVLDEADEMLRMGFIDDVEWILEQTPDARQTALFSATMPQQVRRIADKYLDDPEQITIQVKTATADTIRQRFWPVKGVHKLDALTRILEAETFDAMIIFVRTKTATAELSEKLQARGYSSSPLNGDIAQRQRERTIENLKAGKLDIVVATDVAARGLDVERISHVINYDIPYDTEAYVHRIGRTGRAGKSGEAILFVAPREKRMLSAIEKATRKKIDRMELPSTASINDKRISRFKQRISDTLETENLSFFSRLIEEYQRENEVASSEVAAALAHLLQGEEPLLLKNRPEKRDRKPGERSDKKQDRGKGPKSRMEAVESGMERFRIEVGHDHDVKPGNIVGAIAGEAGLDSQYIGRIDIRDDHSLIDLPEGMPREVFRDLKRAWTCGQQLKISRVDEQSNSGQKDMHQAGSRKKPKKEKSRTRAHKRKQKKEKHRKN